MATQHDRKVIELVLLKYGMKIRKKDGEELGDFNSFDRAGFNSWVESDMQKVNEMLPLDIENEYDFSDSPIVKQLLSVFIRDVRERYQADRHGEEIPDNLRKALVSAYLHGVDDGGNMAIRMLNHRRQNKQHLSMRYKTPGKKVMSAG